MEELLNLKMAGNLNLGLFYLIFTAMDGGQKHISNLNKGWPPLEVNLIISVEPQS